jgi:hypothetical protein
MLGQVKRMTVIANGWIDRADTVEDHEGVRGNVTWETQAILPHLDGWSQRQEVQYMLQGEGLHLLTSHTFLMKPKFILRSTQYLCNESCPNIHASCAFMTRS